MRHGRQRLSFRLRRVSPSSDKRRIPSVRYNKHSTRARQTADCHEKLIDDRGSDCLPSTLQERGRRPALTSIPFPTSDNKFSCCRRDKRRVSTRRAPGGVRAKSVSRVMVLHAREWLRRRHGVAKMKTRSRGSSLLRRWSATCSVMEFHDEGGPVFAQQCEMNRNDTDNGVMF